MSRAELRQWLSMQIEAAADEPKMRALLEHMKATLEQMPPDRRVTLDHSIGG